MNEGPPFKKDDDGPQGPKPVIDEDWKAEIDVHAEAEADFKTKPTQPPHETHIPVERVGDFQAGGLKEVPPAFEALAGITDTPPRDEETSGGFWDRVFVDPNVTRTKETSSGEKPTQSGEKPGQKNEPTTKGNQEKEQSSTVSQSHRPVDGMRRVPKKSGRSEIQKQKEGDGSGYTREQKAIGKIVGSELLNDIERVALERLKKLPNWDKYRFTGELTEDGLLIEKPELDNSGNIKKDEEGNPVVSKPHVRPSEVIFAPQNKKEENKTVEESKKAESEAVKHASSEVVSTPIAEGVGNVSESETVTMDEEQQEPEQKVPETTVEEEGNELPAPPVEIAPTEEEKITPEEGVAVPPTSPSNLSEELPQGPPADEENTIGIETEITESERGNLAQEIPRSRRDGFTQVYEGKFDQQGNKLPGQGSNEETNLAGPLKKGSQENVLQDAKKENPKDIKEKKEAKQVSEDGEVRESTELHKAVREAYRTHRKELLEAEKEWMDAVTEYERRRHESGILGKHIFDFTHSKDQVEKTLTRYNGLLDKTRSMREERMKMVFENIRLQTSNVLERVQKKQRAVALHEALLYSHVDQKATFVERMRVGEGFQKDSTNRYWNFVKQRAKMYAALPPHKKILWGTALATGVGLVAGATGVVAGMGAAGGAALYGGRRLIGGTLGMGAAIGTKLGFNKFAEKRAAKEQQKLKDTFSEKKLSKALSEGVSIRKKERHTKTAGTAAAAAAAVAVGVGTAQVATDVYHSEAFQNSGAGKTLTEFDADVTNAGKTLRGWYEGIKDRITDTPESVEQPATPTTAIKVPETHTVEKGDNVWNILQEKLKAKDVFEGMNERQRTHIIDALKDEVVALSPKELEAMGIESGDPNLIHPGQTLDFSQILDKQSIGDAVAGAPDVSPEHVSKIIENIDASPDTPDSIAVPEQITTQPETVPEIQKPSASQNHLDAETQKPFASESNLSGPEATTAGAVTAADAMPPIEETTEAAIPTDNGPRLQDMPGRSLEQIGKEFPDYRGEKSLPAFKGVWEELKGQEKIDRHLLGRYPHLQSGWGPLSHVRVRDLYDNVQGVQYNIDGKDIALSPQAEAEIRSFVELTRSLPGGDMLEMCVEHNKSVGEYINMVAMRDGLHAAEVTPTTTLAAVDSAQHVQQSIAEQPAQANPAVATEEIPQQAKVTPQERPRRIRDEPRYTRHVDYGAKVSVGPPESDLRATVGVRGRIGAKIRLDEVPVTIGDKMHEDVSDLYEGHSNTTTGWFSRLMLPKPNPEWEHATAGELLKTDPAFRRAWSFWEEGIQTNSIHHGHGLKPELRLADVEKLEGLTGKQALMELIDQAKKTEDARWRPVTVEVGKNVRTGRVYSRTIPRGR